VTLTPYRQVLAAPGIARLLVVATLARVPTTAAGVVLTLHVVVTLGHGYGAAGLVTAAYTIGAALGSPWRGRAVDRLGVRAAVWPSIAAEAAFWVVAPRLPYEALLPGAVVVGLFSLPVFTLTRQAIAAGVPEPLRRTGFALDSMTVELSYMMGPLLAVLVVTQASSTVAMVGVGACEVLAGLALVVLDPAVRTGAEDAVPGPRRAWFTPGFVAVLLLMAASTVALGGTDVAAVAVLRESGHTALIGLVMAAWCGGSLLGGGLYGGLARTAPSAVLVTGLALVTIPLGLARPWWALAAALFVAGCLCAPSVASTVGDVSRLVPEAARGEAMGWHSTAATVGIAVGAPLAGLAIDHAGPGWGFAAAGAVGGLLALVAVAVARRSAVVREPAGALR
jgi:MFS family permease